MVTGILGWGTTQNISFTISSAVMDEVLVFLPGWHEIVTLLQSKMQSYDQGSGHDCLLLDRLCLKFFCFYNFSHFIVYYIASVFVCTCCFGLVYQIRMVIFITI